MKFSRLCVALAGVALTLPACSSVTATVPSPGMPGRLGPASRALAPTKGDLYVADRNANVVKIYAPETDTVKDRITDAPAPVRLAFTRGGLLAVASQRAVRRSPSVFLYKPNATTSYAKITLPFDFDSFRALAFDPKGVLYVANSATVYAYKLDDLAKPALTLAKAGTGIHNVRFNAAGDVAVSSEDGVELFKEGSDKPWGHLTGFAAEDAIYDAGGYLAVAEYGSDRVGIFPPNSTAPSAEITDGINRPNALAVDAKNDLYVASSGGEHQVTVYDDNASTPTRTIKVSWPALLVVASDGDLYVERRYGLPIAVVKPGRSEPSLSIPIDGSDIAISP